MKTTLTRKRTAVSVGRLGAAVIALGAGLCGSTRAPAQAVVDPAPAESPAGVLPECPPEVTPEARQAIERGVAYLISTQNRDGSWRTHGATGSYPVAMTSLAGLALLAGGNTPAEGPYARNVSSALTFVLKSARRDGLIAQLEEESHCMHGHGFAMLFLAQCYGMEEDPRRQAEVRLVLQRAIQLTARSQSAAGGWLYTPDSGGDEGSVTVTQVQALRACRNAGIAVPKQVIDNALAYLEHSTNEADGGIRYQVSDTGPSRPAITAAAIACYYNAGRYDDPRAAKALGFVDEHLSPRGGRSQRYFGHYYYAHLYMAQVAYLTGPTRWSEYYPVMRDVLISKQLNRDDGAWDGDHVGTTYGTAVALIILQLPYKYLPIMQR